MMKIGKLISIDYSQLRVKISSEIRGSSVIICGDIYHFGNIGNYLKTRNALDEVIICEVVSISDSDVHKESQSFDIESNRELVLKPIGTIGTIAQKNKFTLGIGIFPSLYSDVSIVTFEDMKIILDTQAEKKTGRSVIHQSLFLGESKNLIGYKIDINIDKFFNIHSAVLGNSGSGKSNTIAHIVQEILKKSNRSAIGAKIIMFDVNGEYKEAFKKIKNTSSIVFYKPNITGNKKQGMKPLRMPHFLLNLDEWSAFLLATDATQRPFWDRVLQESYRFYAMGKDADKQKQKKLIHYFIYRMCGMINAALGQGDTDTSRVTTAASILQKMKSIVDQDSSLKKTQIIKVKENIDIQIGTDCIKDLTLKGVIEKLSECCSINYGENKLKLQKAVDTISEQIDMKSIECVLNEKYNYGEYYDYKFLKIAADIVLLEEDARGSRQMRNWTATMLTRLDYFLENSDCKFMRSPLPKCKSAEDYIKQVFNIVDNISKSQLIIIDTSELSPDILETLTSVISRLIFDNRKKQQGEERTKNPVHLILDEAHRYVKKDYKYLLKENIFEKIAREGRKYSYYLMISSQRPSELSETALSQCGNFIIHKIQNERDMQYVRSILPYFSDDFTNKIKQSVPGEALIFGSCVSMPLHIKIQQAQPEPNSKNCEISKEWFKKE